MIKYVSWRCCCGKHVWGLLVCLWWWGLPAHQLSKSIEMTGDTPLSKSPFTFTPQCTLKSQRWELLTQHCWRFPPTSVGFGSGKTLAMGFLLSRGQLHSPRISPHNRENLRSYPAGTRGLMALIATHVDLIHPCDRKVLLSYSIPTMLWRTPTCIGRAQCHPPPQGTNLPPCVRRGETYKASA